MNYEVIDGNAKDLEEKIVNAINETRVTNEGRLIVGNDIIIISVEKQNEHKVIITDLNTKKHSKELGNVVLNEYLNLDYFRKVARTLCCFDKRDEEVEVVFSKKAKEFLEKYKISEQVNIPDLTN